MDALAQAAEAAPAAQDAPPPPAPPPPLTGDEGAASGARSVKRPRHHHAGATSSASAPPLVLAPVLAPLGAAAGGTAALQPEVILLDNGPEDALTDAASQRELQERQLEVLTELHALYQKEHRQLLEQLQHVHHDFTSRGGRVLKGDAGPPAQQQQPAAAAAGGAGGPQEGGKEGKQQQVEEAGAGAGAAAPMATAAAAGPPQAETSAGRPVGSLNHWVPPAAGGAAAAAGGTPQSLVRSSATAAAAAGAAGGSLLLTPVSEDPPKTPGLRTTAGATPAAPSTAGGGGGDVEMTAAAPPQGAEHHHTPASHKVQQQGAEPSAGLPEEGGIGAARTFAEAEQALVLRPGGEGGAGGGAAGAQGGRARLGVTAPEAESRLYALESLASAISEMEMEREVALACLVGRTGRFWIRHNAVLLGRATESKGEVDVDLAEAGDAGKVSRRQAFLAVRPDGQWVLTNTGRRPLHVDGRPLGQFEVATLQHLSLLELAGLQLLFMVNLGACERMIRRSQRAAA